MCIYQYCAAALTRCEMDESFTSRLSADFSILDDYLEVFDNQNYVEVDQLEGVDTKLPKSQPINHQRWLFHCRTTSANTHPGGCAVLRIVLVTVPRVSRSCKHFLE